MLECCQEFIINIHEVEPIALVFSRPCRLSPRGYCIINENVEAKLKSISLMEISGSAKGGAATLKMGAG